LVLSEDGFLILQRRSNRVLSGAGGLAASASGFTKWKNDFQRQYISDGVSLRFAATRELEEEIGISEFDLYPESRPFLGAAFNLRYGRDLNFYACFRTKCRIDQVSRKLKDAKDAWELSSLVPVPLTAVKNDGTLDGCGFEAMTLQCNRHLRGALLSLAVSGRLAEWKQLKSSPV
jgi:8-oxo-dGTP pyrophosphatase MutT (NUDIX family)